MQIYLLFIFAFLVRLINLNQSLWLDESIVAKVVKTLPFFQIPYQFSPADFHPPLYYLFMSLWSFLFGYSEIALRMPSILFSLLAGWYVYKIGIRLKGKQIGFWAAAFFLFNPLIIYYSQEARMYLMATMFLTGALYHFMSSRPHLASLAQVRRSNDILLFNVFSALAMFTFYGSAFFITAMIVVGIISSPGKHKFIGGGLLLSIGLLISLLLLSSLLLQQISNAKSSLVDVKNWSLVLGKAELKNILMIFIKFTSGRLSWFPKWSYYLVAGIPTALIWISIFFGVRKNRLFGFLFILPLLFGLFVSFWAPMMMYFRFLYLIPVMSLLLSFGLSNSNRGKIMSLSIFIIFSFYYLFISQFHREDWKGMSLQLNSHIPVYMILPSSDPIAYYRNDVSVYELRSITDRSLPETIVVIPYTNEIYGFNYEAVLQKMGCVKENQSAFRGNLLLEKWRCMRTA